MKRLHPAGSIALIDSTEESNSDSFRSVIDDLTIKSAYQLLPIISLLPRQLTGSQIKNLRSV